MNPMVDMQPQRDDLLNTSVDRVFFSQKVVTGIPWMVASRLVLFFVYFAVPILLARNLGPEKYGMYNLCKLIGESAVAICALGLNAAVIRFIPELRVRQSRVGLLRLLGRAFVLQTVMTVAATVFFFFATPWFDTWFRVSFHLLLLLTGLYTFSRVLKNFVDDSSTALFRVQAVSLMTVCQGVLTFLAVAFLLRRTPETHVAILAIVTPILIVYSIGALCLVRFATRLSFPTPVTTGIGVWRVTRLAFPSILNNIMSMILGQYSELFFIGLFYTPAMVGIYEVGSGFPFMVMTFLPLTLQGLLSSGLAEAYARDTSSLPHLITFLYKTLITLLLPLSALGFFFAPRAIELVYGMPMKEAGPLGALFFLMYTLALFSNPLSMAIIAKERLLHVQPFMFFEITVNLILDYVLISRLGMYGGFLAMFGTFLLTLPIRLYIMSRLIGLSAFPLRFFLKLATVLFAMAGLFSPLANHVAIPGLLIVGVVYLALYAILIRFVGLVHAEDIAELRDLNIHPLNRFLNLLVKPGMA